MDMKTWVTVKNPPVPLFKKGKFNNKEICMSAIYFESTCP
jgi:hypothetical protein